jgi:hypothetical protein
MHRTSHKTAKHCSIGSAKKTRCSIGVARKRRCIIGDIRNWRCIIGAARITWYFMVGARKTYCLSGGARKSKPWTTKPGEHTVLSATPGNITVHHQRRFILHRCKYFADSLVFQHMQTSTGLYGATTQKTAIFMQFMFSVWWIYLVGLCLNSPQPLHSKFLPTHHSWTSRISYDVT